MEMRVEMLSSVSAQVMDTNGYQVSDLDGVEFYWENDQLEVNAVFRSSIGKPFFASTSSDFEMGSMSEDPNLIDKEQDKNSRPHHPTTPVSGRPTQPRVNKKSPIRNKNWECSWLLFQNNFQIVYNIVTVYVFCTRL